MQGGQHEIKKIEYMEKCYDCYAEYGVTGTGIKALANACGCTPANLYLYFSIWTTSSSVHCLLYVKGGV